MWHFVLDHLLATSLFAVGVWGLSHWIRRPAIVHGLWLIVLLKLITPPIALFSLATPDSAREINAVGNDLNEFSNNISTDNVQQNSTPRSDGTLRKTPINTTTPVVTFSRDNWLSLFVIGIWLSGSVSWYFRKARQAVLFSERLSSAFPAPLELQAHTDRLACQLGLKSAPPVVIVPAKISPMLWGVGNKTKLLFPEQMLLALAPAARDTLLVHELAHYRRGDHLVRLVEFVISGLFWCHPLVYWIRNSLEANEEKACDAWVVNRLPESRRLYADALLSTLEFLAHTPKTLPPVATGLGSLPLLRERLIEIMRGAPEPEISRKERFALVTAGAFAFIGLPGLSNSDSSLSVANVVSSWNLIADGYQPGPPRLDPEIAEPIEVVLSEVGAVSQNSAELTDSLLLTPRRNGHERVASIPLLPDTQSGSDWNENRGARYISWESRGMLGNDLRATSPLGNSTIRQLENGSLSWSFSENRQIDLGGKIATAVFSPDGAILATVEEGVIRCWNTTTGNIIREFTERNSEIISLAFSPGGSLLASGSRSGQLQVWNLRGRHQMGSQYQANLPINSVVFSQDGNLICAALGNQEFGVGALLAFDLFRGEHQFVSPTSRGLEAVVLMGDEGLLAAGDWTGCWNTWSLATGEVVGIPQTLPRDVGSRLRFSPVPDDITRVKLISVAGSGISSPLDVPVQTQLTEAPASSHPAEPAQAG